MTEGELGLLGLGARAGQITVGTQGVRAALKRGRVALVVLARDRSARTEEKVVRLARAAGVRLVVGPAALELGRRVGRGAVQSVGIEDVRLAAGIGGAARSRRTRG